MSSLLILLLTTLLSTYAQYQTTWLSVPLLHGGCGNIEFDVSFMKPRLTLYDSRQLLNFSVTDTMDLNNPMRVALNGQAKYDPLVID